MDRKVRLLLVDDQIRFRKGLACLLDAEPVFEIAGQAGSVRDALKQARDLRPDLVLLGTTLPDGTGVDAARRILHSDPDCNIIFLTGADDRASLVPAMREGARGFLSKDVPLPRLVAGLYDVGRGEAWLSGAA